MTILMNCSNCGKQLRLSDDVAGKRFRCNQCETILRAPLPEGSVPEVRTGASQGSEFADHESQPHSSSTDSSAEQQEVQGQQPGKSRLGLRQELPVPQELQEFEKVAFEIKVFYIGLAVVIGLCAGFIYFFVPMKPHDGIGMLGLKGLTISSAVSLAMGLLAATKSLICMKLLRPLNFLCAIPAGLFGLYAAVNGSLIPLLLPMPFVIASNRIQKAIDVHPNS